MDRGWVSIAALGLVACVPDLSLPNAARVWCGRDADCPTGLVCEATLGECVGAGFVLPEVSRPTLAFSSPADGATAVPWTLHEILLVFTLDIDAPSLAGRITLTADGGPALPLDAVASDAANTFVVPLAADTLAMSTTYTLRLDAGISSPSGGPTLVPIETTFSTESADITPPEPPSAVVIDVRPDVRILTFARPADATGVLIVRAENAEVVATPTRGAVYPSGTPLGNGSVVGFTADLELADSVTADRQLAYALYAFDAAGNFSAGTAPPLVTATDITWCPSEVGTFSSSTTGPATQRLHSSPVAGVAPSATTLFPAVGEPSNTVSTMPVDAYVVEDSRFMRLVVEGTGGVVWTLERSVYSASGSLRITAAPPNIGPGSTTGLSFAPDSWTNFEAAVDSDFTDGENYDPGGEVSFVRGDTLQSLFMAAGEYRFRVRPVLAGCAAAPWTESDPFYVGLFFYVRPGGTGTGSSPSSPLGTIQAAVDAATAAASGAPGSPVPELFIAGGSYTEQVTVAQTVTLHGGYSDDFLSRDGAAGDNRLPACVPGCVTEVDGGAGPALTITDGAVQLESLTFGTISGDRALWVNGAQVTAQLTRVRVEGGLTPMAEAMGLYAQSCTLLTVLGSTLFSAGEAETTLGLDAECPVAINDTAITVSPTSPGANGTGLSVVGADLDAQLLHVTVENIDDLATGILCDGDCILVGNNVTLRPPDSYTARGLDVRDGDAQVIANRVVISAGLYVVALRLEGVSSGVVANNILLSGAATGRSAGLTLVGTGTFVLPVVYNVIFGGQALATASATSAMELLGPAYVINNVLGTFGAAVGVPAYGVYDDTAHVGFSARTLRNNLFFDTPDALVYCDDCGWVAAGEDDVEGLNDLVVTLNAPSGEHARLGGNLVWTDTLVDLFYDPNGSDDRYDTLDDNNWLLSTESSAVRFGGIDATSDGCGTVENAAICSDVDYDFFGDGNPAGRTCPAPAACTTLGAFELD